MNIPSTHHKQNKNRLAVTIHHTSNQSEMGVCQNLVPLVNVKIAGKWMFIPLKIVLIGIDPFPNRIQLFFDRTRRGPTHYWDLPCRCPGRCRSSRAAERSAPWDEATSSAVWETWRQGHGTVGMWENCQGKWAFHGISRGKIGHVISQGKIGKIDDHPLATSIGSHAMGIQRSY